MKIENSTVFLLLEVMLNSVIVGIVEASFIHGLFVKKLIEFCVREIVKVMLKVVNFSITWVTWTEKLGHFERKRASSSFYA